MNISDISVPFITVLSIPMRRTGETKYTELICSLHSGTAADFRDSILFPSEREVEIRKIERGSGDSVSVFLKGIGRKEIEPGAVIIPADYPAAYTRNAYGVFFTDAGRTAAGGKVSEGNRDRSYQVVNTFPIPSARNVDEEITAAIGDDGWKIVFSRHILLCPGVPVCIVSSDVGEERKTFLPVLVHRLPRDLERETGKRLPINFSDGSGRGDIWRFRAAYSGYTRLPSSERQKFLHDPQEGLTVFGSLLVRSSWPEETEKEIMVRVEHEPGTGLRALSGSLGMERFAVESLIHRLAAAGRLKNEHGKLYPVVREAGDGRNLSPAARNIRMKLLELDLRGIGIKAPEFRSLHAVFDELVGKGYAVFLTGEILYSHEALQSCILKIREGRQPGDPVTVQDVKATLGLSRTYVLPIIDTLVELGILERKEGTVIIAEK